MYKILLHVGLPKTATTSLQDNILIPLHKQGVINFIDINFLFKADMTKSDFEQKLEKNKLNVISEERITETDKDKYEIFIERLSILLKDYEVKTYISLRNPIDFIYSYYIQSYPQVYSQLKELNTFEKFVNYLEINEKEKSFKMFFTISILKYMQEKFGNLHISFYEDLKYKDNCYFEMLAQLLGMDKNIIKKDFYIEKKNVKSKNEEGKFSRKLRLTEVLRISQLKQKNKFLYKIMKFTLLIEIIRFIDPLFVKFISKKVLHVYPDKNLTKKLENLFLKNNTLLVDKFNLSVDKLKKYNYILENDNEK